MSTLFLKNFVNFRFSVLFIRNDCVFYAAVLRKYQMGFEIQFISSNQFELNAVPYTFLCKPMTGSVKMSIETAAHIISLQNIKDLLALIAFISGRIM